MTQSRQYDDPCGIARALDVIGDRWALLVVRELIFGPKRFAQLRSGLHSVSPNVLSQRLRDLEEAGVVSRGMLAPPASVAVYELADRGRALEPVLLELGRWGSREPIGTSRELTPDAFMLALKSAFDPSAAHLSGASAGNVIFELGIDGDTFTVMVSAGSLDIMRGRHGHPAVCLRGDAATMRQIAFGREPVAAAERAGRLTVTGDRALAEAFTRMFPVRRAEPSARM
ncbi:MAG TPA: winged helix-turn-helix transcriptional regulator [Streptosporangiaceae bacterium]